MADSSSANIASAEHFVIERSFDAPAALVWKAWTEPEHFKKWIAPEGFSIPFCEIDLRVGGKLRFIMKGQGMEHHCGGEYKVIDPPRKLVSTDYFTDADWNVVEPSSLGFPEGWPKVNEVTISFREEGGKTHLKVEQPMISLSLAKQVGADMGWNSSLDNLATLLAKQS